MSNQPSLERLVGITIVEPDDLTLTLRAASKLDVGRGGGGGRGGHGGGRGGWGGGGRGWGGRGGRHFGNWYGAPGGGWYGWWGDPWWYDVDDYLVVRPRARPGFGYWHNLAGVPVELFDETWAEDERATVAGALLKGESLGVTVFPTDCKVKGCGETLGNMARTDGVIDYPEGLAHYVEKHAVRIPGDMVIRALTK